jgi:integrase
MRIHIYRRKGDTPYWQAQLYIGGKRFRFSCQTDDKETAREYARQRIVELKARHNRGLIGLPEPVRISAVFKRYELEYLPRLRPASQERMMHVVTEARHWFVDGPLHDCHITSVTPNDVQAFLERKRAQGVSARTVNLYRANLHRVFHLCVRPWLLIANNPVAAVEPLRQELREPYIVSKEEYHQLRESSHHNELLQLFTTLAWETGARLGELLQLEWEDVDFEHKLITFANDPARERTTKGRRSRIVPLSDEAVRTLRDHAALHRLAAPRSPYVFRHVGSDNTRRSASARSLYDSFKRAAKKIGLPTLRPHDLRHAFVTRKLADGVPAQLVMRYVGHADLATTLRYTHLVPEHLRAVVESERTIPSRSMAHE